LSEDGVATPTIEIREPDGEEFQLLWGSHRTLILNGFVARGEISGSAEEAGFQAWVDESGDRL
jgi:hypothetical protein